MNVASRIFVSALAISSTNGLMAQESAAGVDNGDIIVTAQKRATNLQTTGAAISVLGGDALQLRQVSNVEGLAQSLPNVNFGQTTGNARIAIRGVGFDNLSLGNEGRVAYHADGVYISRPAAALAGFYDVERVEVLRGPQGTLYGRNATGGAINVISRRPSEQMNGFIEATVGNYKLFKAEGAIGGRVSDGLSARVSFQVIDRGGYGKNLTTGVSIDDQSSQAIRGQLRFNPSEVIDLTLSGDYFTQDDHAYSFHYLGQGSRPNPLSTPALPGSTPKGLLVGGVVPSNPRNSTSDSGPSNNREFWGMALNGKFQLGSLELNSLTAYRHSSFHTVTDLDGTSARLSVYDQLENSDQFSQELRLSGDFNGGDWMIGGYYFHEKLFGGTRVALDPLVVAAPPLPLPTNLRQGFFGMGHLKTKAYAAFANIRYEFIDGLSLRLGARYSDERKSVDELLKIDFATPYPPFVPIFPTTPPGARRQTSENWSSFSPSATLEYKANDDLFAYATFSKGFKSGGFNLGNLQPAFRPEKIDDYELGVRADWFDGKLRTNVSGFYYKYSNLQVSKVNGTSIMIENAANAVVYGMEAELSARPVDRLNISANFALLDSRYKNYTSADPARSALGAINLTGNELTQAPHYTVNADASYTAPTDFGDITMRVEGRWVGKSYFTQFNLDHVGQASYALFNAFLSWESNSGNWNATAYVRNIGNRDIVSAALVGTGLVGFPLMGSLEPPRTFGLSVGYRF